jgi:predicted nuclease of predicted toxin-antitoxin system
MKDEDFVQRHALIGSGPPVVWIRLPNTVWFAAVLPDVLSALKRGETLIEVV